MWIFINKISIWFIIKIIILMDVFPIIVLMKLSTVGNFSNYLCKMKQFQVPIYKESHNTLNLNGQNYATFHFNAVGINGNIFFEFRTREENQIIFNLGLTSMWKQQTQMNVDFYLLGYLLNGALVVNMLKHFPIAYLNGETQRVISCVSDYDTCADTQWHQTLLRIKQNDIFIILDSQSPVKINFPGQEGSFTVKIMQLGASYLTSSKETITNSMNQTNFRGCFRSVIYKNGEIFVPMLMTKSTKYVRSELPIQSNLRNCDYKLLQPRLNINSAKINSFVSFTKPGNYLRITGWKVVLHGEITFTLRTTTLNGLIIYSNSVSGNEMFPRKVNEPNLLENIQDMKQTGFDIFALELRLGRLHFLLNTGSGIVQPEFDKKYFESESKGFISDGKEHTIQIVFDEGDLTINVDGENFVTHGIEIKTYKYLNLNEHFYIGGLPESMRHINSFISPEVWSAQLRQDFVGCLGNFIVNNRLWDVDLERRPCWSKPFVESGCEFSLSTDLCTDKPCKNNGQCFSNWNIFECDCSYTNFSGKTCTENPTIVSLNGFQWLWVKFSPLPIQSSVEELTLRFRTKHKNGFLLTTRSSILSAPDCLELKIISGYLVLIYNLGESDNMYHNPVYVSNDQWHTVKVYRRQNFLNFSVDNLLQTFDIPNDGRFLSHRHMIFGASEDLLTDQLIDSSTHFRHIKQINNLNLHVFIGYLMVFLFNGVDFLRTAQNLKHDPSLYIWKDKLDITATQSDYEPILELPVTFIDKDSSIELQLKHPTSEFILEMWIKWKKYGTILFLQDGYGQNFILELTDGRLQFIHENNEQAEKHFINANQKLIEREWYHLKVIKKELIQSILIQVNDQSTYVKLNNSKYFTLKTITIGSQSKRKSNYITYDNYMQGTTGFQGCLASFLLNYSIDYGRLPLNIELNNNKSLPKYRLNYLYSNETQTVDWHNIQMGCHHLDSKHQEFNHCLENPCHFNGMCKQQWNSVTCDCSLTGFTGKFCDNPGTSVLLSELPRRYAIFELNSPQNTTLDRLAFGIQIINPGSMSLLHIQGQGQSSDYIQLSVLHNKSKNQLNLLVRYNMGGGTQTLFQPNVNFDDGHFHIVQFIRHESKGILWIDFQHEITKPIEDQNNKHFNLLKRIYFGEPLKTNEKLIQNNVSELITKEGFEGFITGLNFNSINLIDLLNGNMIPGIYLKTRVNIKLNPNFKPNMEKLHAHKKRIEPETTNQNEANDMQLTATDIHDKSIDYKTQSIVVPKKDCLKYDNNYNYKECQPVDMDGIIRPLITFNDNTLTMRAVDKNEPQQGWNADQSNNNRITSTSDNYQQHGYSKFDQSIINQDEMEPLITSWFNSSKKMSQKQEDITPALDKMTYKKDDLALDNAFYDKSKSYFNSFVGRNKKFPFNIVLIIAVSVSGICLLIILTCIIYRCMRRDEGTYNVEESTAYTGETLQTSSVISSRKHIINDSTIPLLNLQPELIKSVTLLKPNSEISDIDDRSLTKFSSSHESYSTNDNIIVNNIDCENNPDVIVTDKTNNTINTITYNSDNNIHNTLFINSISNKQTRKSCLKTENRKSTVNPKEWYV